MSFLIVQEIERIDSNCKARFIAGKYRILETYMSLNGLRTRVCDGRFDTIEQAEAELEGK